MPNVLSIWNLGRSLFRCWVFSAILRVGPHYQVEEVHWFVSVGTLIFDDVSYLCAFLLICVSDVCVRVYVCLRVWVLCDDQVHLFCTIRSLQQHRLPSVMNTWTVCLSKCSVATGVLIGSWLHLQVCVFSFIDSLCTHWSSTLTAAITLWLRIKLGHNLLVQNRSTNWCLCDWQREVAIVYWKCSYVLSKSPNDFLVVALKESCKKKPLNSANDCLQVAGPILPLSIYR